MGLSHAIDSKLVSQARTFEVIAWVATVILAVHLLILLKLLGLIGPAADAFSHGDWMGLRLAAEPVLLRLVEFLPVVIYLGGLMAAARIFGRVADGELFSKANSNGLAEVGSSLLWGAAASAVIVPWIQSWIDGEYGFSGIHLEVETWVIAVIGGAILVLGRMMVQAGRMQSELDQIL
ncbi:MAG: DUF2975 domain-containing protein [Caulobacterales bacterium]|nr:DUF2975 domain-containing protein [Caulobacterales bacterium]